MIWIEREEEGMIGLNFIRKKWENSIVFSLYLVANR